ncbi:hypothetical protein IWQ55_006592 [Labrenzia sp. EL_208]|nr:hypothetical protein [Labrenzia sp. EL_132]MBG6209760.1 hypothetical protein [Labrenzia sp. EL_126]MBG6233350.1 hypothetical protein [Labrenzia sp. EL_208]
MFKKLALVALLTSLSGPALAVTLDFEGILGNTTNCCNTYNGNGPSKDGFNLVLSHGHVIKYNYGGYQNHNGTDWLMHDSGGNMTLTSDHGPFSLDKLDHASYLAGSLAQAVVTGYLNGGGTVTKTLSTSGVFSTIVFGWTNLLSVTFDAQTSRNAYDNIVVNKATVVPLPAALPLLAGGLGLLGFMGWRRKRAA